MTRRQGLVAIEERLEIEDVPVAVELRQKHLAAAEGAAPSRATITDDSRKTDPSRAASQNIGGMEEIPRDSGTVRRIEIGLAPWPRF